MQWRPGFREIAMADKTPTPAPDLSHLTWKSEWEFQVATDSRCLYIRESSGSIFAASVFTAGIVGTAGYLSWSIFFPETPNTLGEKAFGGLMLFVAGFFAWIPWLTLKRGRWMVVFDRGEPASGIQGEIRYQGKSLPAERVRGFSTRSCGGSPPRSTVVAELHDGTPVSVGPVSISTWPAHYAQQAATWMGLPFRYSSN